MHGDLYNGRKWLLLLLYTSGLTSIFSTRSTHRYHILCSLPLQLSCCVLFFLLLTPAALCLFVVVS